MDADLAELASNLEQLQRENDTLTQLLSADATLLKAFEMVKQLQRENAALRERVAGLMEEKNIAIRAAKKGK